MQDQDRRLIYGLMGLVTLTLLVSCASLLVLSFIAGGMTGNKTVPVLVTSVPTFSTPTLFLQPSPPMSVNTSKNLLTNGDLDEDDFGTIVNWAQTNIDLSRWYLVQDVSPSGESGNARWIERVDLTQVGRGYGLRSVDYQNCDYFCSVTALQIIPAEGNKIYALSVEARREQGSGGSIYLDFLNENRQRIKPYTKGGYGDQWESQTITAQAPEGTKYIRVALYSSNGSQGIVDWDNVELKIDGE
ncbi:MAG: hypothetical protein GY832_14010 [Chloroflexi bacterium]|nr:hypothetical protein [Chloroflexota bacterium]